MSKHSTHDDVIAVIAHEGKLDPQRAGELRTALAGTGAHIRWIAIDKGSASTKATRRAIERGAGHVVVAGGDGTVRGAIDALAGTDIPLSVLPSGTANQFAGALGLPTDPADVVAALQGGRTRRLDTGRCNEMAFALMAGTGLDAALIDAADDDKERLGTLAYVRAGLREAREREPFDATVTVDGEPLFDGSATCVLVANIGSLKGGIEAFPAASPVDGRLDVAVITASGLREWGALMASALRGKHLDSGHVHVAQGSQVKVVLDKKHRYELDGGTKGTTKELDIDVVPSSLSVCVAA